MNKFVWVLCLLIFFRGGVAYDQEGFPLLSGIYLVDSGDYAKGLPPSEITVGFQVRSEALYKISSRGRVIKGGIFQKGFNSIDLEAGDFFDRTETHSFLLECKAGEAVIQKEIMINIRIFPLYIVQKRGEERKRHEFTLAFYLGDRMIYATKKFPARDISFTLELPPSTGQYNPFGLIDGAKKPVSGIPIMGAVSSLYQLAKSLSPRKKNEEGDRIIEKKQQIEMTFLKTDMLGDLWQWRALVSLKSSDPDKERMPTP